MSRSPGRSRPTGGDAPVAPAAPAAPRRRGGNQVIPRPADARPGHAAPWASLPTAERRLDIARVAAALDRRGPGRALELPMPGGRHSAVLCGLFDEEGESHVLLTRRAQHLRNHKGEVSFPGGRMDPGETPIETAAREAFEEVALDPTLISPIGELDHLTTFVSRSFIVPVVAALPGRPTGLVGNPHEVERVFTVPLSELTADGVFREERWGVVGLDRPITFFELEGETVWGATAAMLRQLLVICLGLEAPAA